jgi:hypothetical protein
MTKRFLTVILITLFSAVAMFANDISTEVQEEQKIEQQATPDFSSDSSEFSNAEKNFANKYQINPRNTKEVWFKHKSLIKTGIGLAVGGGVTFVVGFPTFIGIASGMLFVNTAISVVFYVLGALIGLGGFLVMALSSIPFVQSGMLRVRYKKLYNVKLKDAAVEAGIVSMHNSENREFAMAMAFGIN